HCNRCVSEADGCLEAITPDPLIARQQPHRTGRRNSAGHNSMRYALVVRGILVVMNDPADIRAPAALFEETRNRIRQQPRAFERAIQSPVLIEALDGDRQSAPHLSIGPPINRAIETRRIEHWLSTRPAR